MSTPGLAADLAVLSRDPDPAVRLPGLAGLAAAGDEPARHQLALEVRGAARSSDVALRVAPPARSGRSMRPSGPPRGTC
jgi:hypothetical protein